MDHDKRGDTIQPKRRGRKRAGRENTGEAMEGRREKVRKTQAKNRQGTQKTIVELLGAETRNTRMEERYLGSWDSDVEFEEQTTRQGPTKPTGPPEWL